MKTFIIINGKNMCIIKKENLEIATVYAQNFMDHSHEIIVREINDPTI